jgi:uncharacterized protein with NRDE domain
MCLVAFALDQRSRFPFVMAANRDEFFNRPAARLGWWEPESGGPAILGGRDLHAGGTWLGLTALGRLGLVTNVRDPRDTDPQAPSRGQIVPQWLQGDQHMSTLWPRLAMSGHNGFNMIALDFAQGECYWVNNRRIYPERLQRGIFGLSNAQLNTPWPKVQALKGRMKAAIPESQDAEELVHSLFEALGDPARPPDAQLPCTGVPHDWERLLSSAFIRAENGLYGTRCSTVIVTERVNKRLVTHVMERTFAAQSHLTLLRRVTLKNWPPRHTMLQAEVARLGATLPPPSMRHGQAFEASDISEHDDQTLMAEGQAKRQRARSLIKSGPGSPVKV